MQMRDVVGTIYRDEQFADLFPVRGQVSGSAVASGVGDRL
jgi:hypothetical protein